MAGEFESGFDIGYALGPTPRGDVLTPMAGAMLERYKKGKEERSKLEQELTKQAILERIKRSGKETIPSMPDTPPPEGYYWDFNPSVWRWVPRRLTGKPPTPPIPPLSPEELGEEVGEPVPPVARVGPKLAKKGYIAPPVSTIAEEFWSNLPLIGKLFRPKVKAVQPGPKLKGIQPRLAETKAEVVLPSEASRQKAIDYLRQRNVPITEKNIEATIKKFGY